MALRYSRWSPHDRALDVEEHVRAHLSSVADANDNPATYADQVRISRENEDDGVLVIGELDAELDARYLSPDFDPEQDVAANPLTVEPIEEQQ
jgi:hypothetical protein